MTTSQTTALLAQADLVLLSADLLRSPCRHDDRLWDVDSAELGQLFTAASLDPSAFKPLHAALEQARQLDHGVWTTEYCRLFEGAMVCPLNQTVFVRRDKGAIIGDLAGFYRAFGWSPTACEGEKADHLLVELEFLAVLMVMLARAIRDGHTEHETVTRQALCGFAGDHLADWLTTACAQLREAARLPLYGYVAEALENLWNALVLVHNWPRSPSTAPPPDLGDLSDSPYECDAAAVSSTVPLTLAGRLPDA